MSFKGTYMKTFESETMNKDELDDNKSSGDYEKFPGTNKAPISMKDGLPCQQLLVDYCKEKPIEIKNCYICPDCIMDISCQNCIKLRVNKAILYNETNTGESQRRTKCNPTVNLYYNNENVNEYAQTLVIFWIKFIVLTSALFGLVYLVKIYNTNHLWKKLNFIANFQYGGIICMGIFWLSLTNYLHIMDFGYKFPILEYSSVIIGIALITSLWIVQSVNKWRQIIHLVITTFFILLCLSFRYKCTVSKLCLIFQKLFFMLYILCGVLGPAICYIFDEEHTNHDRLSLLVSFSIWLAVFIAIYLSGLIYTKFNYGRILRYRNTTYETLQVFQVIYFGMSSFQYYNVYLFHKLNAQSIREAEMLM